MDDPLRVGFMNHARERLGQPDRGQDLERLDREQLGERAAVDVLADQVEGALVHARFMNRDDAGEPKPGDRAGLREEPRAVPNGHAPPEWDHLEGDQPVGHPLPRLVHHARDALAQRPEDHTAADLIGAGPSDRGPRRGRAGVADGRERIGTAAHAPLVPELFRETATHRTARKVLAGAWRPGGRRPGVAI